MITFDIKIPSEILKWNITSSLLANQIRITEDFVEITDHFSLVRFYMKNELPKCLENRDILIELFQLRKHKKFSKKLPKELTLTISYTGNVNKDNSIKFEDAVFMNAFVGITQERQRPNTDKYFDYNYQLKELPKELLEMKKFMYDISVDINSTRLEMKNTKTNQVLLQDKIDCVMLTENRGFIKDKNANSLIFLDNKKKASYAITKCLEDERRPILYIKQDNIEFIELLS